MQVRSTQMSCTTSSSLPDSSSHPVAASRCSANGQHTSPTAPRPSALLSDRYTKRRGCGCPEARGVETDEDRYLAKEWDTDIG